MDGVTISHPAPIYLAPYYVGALALLVIGTATFICVNERRIKRVAKQVDAEAPAAGAAGSPEMFAAPVPLEASATPVPVGAPAALRRARASKARASGAASPSADPSCNPDLAGGVAEGVEGGKMDAPAPAAAKGGDAVEEASSPPNQECSIDPRVLCARLSSRGPLLDAVVAFVYPASLGADEGVAHLSMRAMIAMIAHCGNTGIEECNNWAFFTSTSAWVMSSIATVWYLHVVFRRYETTHALPIEYGTVTFFSVCSGLIFYGESRYMNNWQLALTIVGALIITVGISLGQFTDMDYPRWMVRIASRCSRRPRQTAGECSVRPQHTHGAS